MITLKRTIHLVGREPFSGRKAEMFIKPATGRLTFKLKGKLVPVDTNHIGDNGNEHTTIVANNECQIKGVEHLLSALTGMGVNSALIETNATEVPFLNHDSSAVGYCQLIRQAGWTTNETPLNRFIPSKQITFYLDGSLAIIRPAPETTISTLIQFPEPIGEQYYSVKLNPDSYWNDIAWARSFIRSDCDEAVWKNCRKLIKTLPRDISESPVLAFRDGKWLTTIHPFEPVRHKILDFIGDMTLLGSYLAGNITLIRPGHAFNRALVKYLANQ